jgi:hypothetical protein
MIPAAHLQQWAATAPWPERRQVEQDLVISRVLVDLFTTPGLADKIAFRGGTAIHKLLFPRPLRYSEDIDGGHFPGWGTANENSRDALCIWCFVFLLRMNRAPG